MTPRDWFKFHRGSPRQPRGASFVVLGPWAVTDDDGTPSDRYGALGDHTRDGWKLRWSVTDRGRGRRFYELTVETFGDLLAVVRLGPVEAGRRIDAATRGLAKRLGVSGVAQMGRV